MNDARLDRFVGTKTLVSENTGDSGGGGRVGARVLTGLLRRHLHRQPVRRLLARLVGRVLGDLPAVGALVEVLRGGDVVLRQHVPLDLEQVLGIPQVLHEVRRDVRLRVHDAREDLRPRLEHRVVVPRVERDLAGVGVDGRLDRVADVVDLVGRQRDVRRGRGQRVADHLLERLALGVRVAVGRRVAVEDPQHPVADDGRVGVAVDGQPRRDLLDPLAGVPLVEDLRVLVHPARQQDVGLAELDARRAAC